MPNVDPIIRKLRKHPEYLKQRQVVFDQEDVCYLCGRLVDKTLPREHDWAKEVDHVIPITRNGHPWARSNLRLTHNRCNGIKGPRLLSELKANEFDICKREIDGFLRPSRRNILAEIRMDDENDQA